MVYKVAYFLLLWILTISDTDGMNCLQNRQDRSCALCVIQAGGDLAVTEKLEGCSENQERAVMYKFYMGNFCKWYVPSMPNCYWSHKILKKLGFKTLGNYSNKEEQKFVVKSHLSVLSLSEQFWHRPFKMCIRGKAYLLTLIAVYILDSGDQLIFGKVIEKYPKLFLMGKLFLLHSLKTLPWLSGSLLTLLTFKILSHRSIIQLWLWLISACVVLENTEFWISVLPTTWQMWSNGNVKLNLVILQCTYASK